MEPTIDSIIAKLEGISFSELSQEEQTTLEEAFRPAFGKPFTQEQRDLMQPWFLIVPEDKLSELDTLNAGKNHIASTVTLVDSAQVLHCSLLSDSRPGEIYGHLRDFLIPLKFRTVSSSDFPVWEE